MNESDNEISREAFQDILTERKAIRTQLARDRREKDLRSIQDQDSRSKTGLHTLEYCPKELWAMILDLLSLEERQSMYSVHDLFQIMMEENRIRDILFPLLLRISGATVTLENGKIRPFAGIPLLRQVSKSLKNEVDLYFEDNLLKNLRLEFMENNFDGPLPKTCLQMTGYEKLQRMIQICFEGPKAEKPTRLVLRSLSVFLLPDTYNRNINHRVIFQQFKEDVTTFLEHIGGQVLHFTVYCSELEVCGQTDADVYFLLCDWLDMMPNLKWLDVHFMIMGNLLSTVGGCEAVDVRIPLEKAIKDRSLPELRDLERLDLDLACSEKTNVQFMEAIIKAYQHVKVLNPRESLWDSDSLSPTLVQLVRSLKLEAIMFTNEEQKIYDISVINKKWPLKRMHLHFADSDCPSIGALFRFLENFQSLELLHLGLGFRKISEPVTYLRLPNLTHFKCELSLGCRIEDDFHWETEASMRFYLSLQFPLYSAKLEWLEWSGFSVDTKVIPVYKATTESDSFIDFQNGLRDLTDSNVWDVFPYLKHIRVKYLETEEENRNEYGNNFVYCKLQGREHLYQRRKLIY